MVITGMILAAGVATAHARAAVIIEPSPVGAALEVVSPASTSLVWNPQYEVGRTVSLCVASSTGSYDLSVLTSLSGMPKGAQQVDVVLTYKDETGAKVFDVKPGARIEIRGQVRRDLLCRGQTTATLTFALDDQSVLSGVAGDYDYGLDLSVSPR